MSGRDVLILGGADCLPHDRGKLGLWTGPIVAINETGIAEPHFDLWVSLHPDKLHFWMQKRGKKDFLSCGIHAKFGDYCDFYQEPRWNGSSGLYAVDVVLSLGAKSVVLCGIPMDGSNNAHRGQPWRPFEHYRKGWLAALPELKGRVRSMSGWTREVLE